MKKLLPALFILIGPLANGQHVLNSNEMIGIGAIEHIKYILDLTVVDTTIQGANSTWDVSALVNDPGIPDFFSATVDPASTPNGASFPNSNYAFVESPATAYRYFNLTSTKMERVGSYISSVNTYNDPQVEYVFPFQIGVSNNDTWDNTNSSFGGTYNLECIGDGQLILPGGTYTDVIMVRIHFEETLYEGTAYAWYDASNGLPLLFFVDGDDLFITDGAYYLYELSIGIEENDIFKNVRYNNPVTEVFQMAYYFQGSKKLSYSLTNSLGQLQETGKINCTDKEQYFEKDFSRYAPGVYFFTVVSDKPNEKPFCLKIVKE